MSIVVNRYMDEEGNLIQEITVQSIDITKDEIEDNCFIGSYGHINLNTCPSWFLQDKPKLLCKGRTIPYERSWKDLGNRYPIGKVLKLNGYFCEVVSLSVDVDTEAVRDKSFIETDLFKADIKVKPYGSDGNGDKLISILFTSDPEVTKRW